MVRIGIVCEGPTDVHAIENFLGASLKDRGIKLKFVYIQPEKDKTRPGGWSSVLNWLRNNPPKFRTNNYLSGGLFDGDLSAKSCDMLLFQMDADIIADRSFQNWTRDNLGYQVTNSPGPIQRGNEIRMIIENAGDFNQLSQDESKRHIPAPAVESTEAWCVAVYGRFSGDPEQLKGPDLCEEFMRALHLSEDRVLQPFRHIDKNPDRRRRYCERHADEFRRVETQCHHYRELVASVVRLAESI